MSMYRDEYPSFGLSTAGDGSFAGDGGDPFMGDLIHQAVPNEANLLTPQAQFLRRAYQGLQGAGGPGTYPYSSAPAQQIAESLRQSVYAPAMGGYYLSQAGSPAFSTGRAPFSNLTFGQYLDDLRTPAGMEGRWMGSPDDEDIMAGWRGAIGASRGWGGLEPTDRDISPYAAMLTGDPAMQIAQYALGGPTRGHLGRLHADRARRSFQNFQLEQLMRGGEMLPEEAFLGQLAARLPSNNPFSKWANQPTLNGSAGPTVEQWNELQNSIGPIIPVNTAPAPAGAFRSFEDVTRSAELGMAAEKARQDALLAAQAAALVPAEESVFSPEALTPGEIYRRNYPDELVASNVDPELDYLGYP